MPTNADLEASQSAAGERESFKTEAKRGSGRIGCCKERNRIGGAEQLKPLTPLAEAVKRSSQMKTASTEHSTA